MINSATTAIPIVPEMLASAKEVKDYRRGEEQAAASVAEPETPQRSTPKPTHPDEVGKLCNVEA